MQKNTIAAIISSATVFAFFVLVLPQYDSIKLVKEAIASRQTILNERVAASNKVRELDNQARARQSDINKIKSFLPERKQADEIVSSVQKIAESAGMQILSLTTADSTGQAETRYKKILIGIDVAGPYPSFVNFLKLAEQSLRLYDVYEVNAAASSTSTSNVNFSVKIYTYYLK